MLHTSHSEGFGNTGSTKIVKYGTFTGIKVKFGPFLEEKIVKFHKNTKKIVKYGNFTGKKRKIRDIFMGKIVKFHKKN